VTGSPSITSFSTFTALIPIAQPPAAGRDAVRPAPPQPQQTFNVPIDRRGPATVVEVGTAKQVEPVPRPPAPRDVGADEKRLQRASDVRDVATLQGTPLSAPAAAPAPARVAAPAPARVAAPAPAPAVVAPSAPGPIAAPAPGAIAAAPASAPPAALPPTVAEPVPRALPGPARPIVPPGSRVSLLV
jgi:2-oxoglutarate dehydrogenase E2 component (dihydrolipoamide succinyltransferase)